MVVCLNQSLHLCRGAYSPLFCQQTEQIMMTYAGVKSISKLTFFNVITLKKSDDSYRITSIISLIVNS